MIDQQLAIRCRGLSKRFGSSVALSGFNLDVWEGNIVSVLGPSGCGKTTALRAIAGFEQPDEGTVEIHGTPVVGDGRFVAPERRRVGMVFQDYALFPHLTVAANVAYGVGSDARSRVDAVLDLVGLSGLGRRMPHELSGGQQQRVALARALAPGPSVVLLDEPFSNLDAALRDRVRREVREILRESGTTAVFVTHDQEEALALSDVVAVMHDGTVVQAAPPDELYRRPASRWVAGFVGDADFLSGMANGGEVTTLLGTFPTVHEGPVSVMIRPESVLLTADPSGQGEVIDREFFGHDQLYVVRLAGGETVRVRTGSLPVFRRHDKVQVAVSEAVTFPA